MILFALWADGGAGRYPQGRWADIVYPNYFVKMTASFRTLYERLVFQNLTYNRETPCCNQNPILVLLIMISNAPDTAYIGL